MNLKCWWKGHDLYNHKIEGKHCYKCKECEIVTNKDWLAEKSFWDRHENVKIGSVLLLVFIIFIGVMHLLILPPVYLGCLKTAQIMELPFKYDYWSGCFYQIDGRWISSGMLDIVELLK